MDLGFIDYYLQNNELVIKNNNQLANMSIEKYFIVEIIISVYMLYNKYCRLLSNNKQFGLFSKQPKKCVHILRLYWYS